MPVTKANAESCSRDGLSPCSIPGWGQIRWLKVLVGQMQCVLAVGKASCPPHCLTTAVASKLE